MPRATCRCGQKLSIPVNGPERVICPKCQARIRVRKDSPDATAIPGAAGFIRFECNCGRRLKVRAAPGAELPQAGKCPDCGRIVTVPSHSTATTGPLSTARVLANSETRTEEMDNDDLAALGRWTQDQEARHRPPAARVSEEVVRTQPQTSNVVVESVSNKIEAGLRICPQCGRPVHLSAVACRDCGAPVPKR